MVYLSRIYTKTGDAGETGLGDGSRVSKDHIRVTAYGEVDELNSVLGLIRAYCPDYVESSLLRDIQNDLFDVGADLCMPQSASEPEGAALRVTASQSEKLERAIDRVNDHLQPLHSFILPGGSQVAAWLHLARTVCRRAERSVVTLAKDVAINESVVIYLNRLSDLLFVLSRAVNNNGKDDVLWVPGKNR
jgi:cob(I)alamin adenosyltransferase